MNPNSDSAAHTHRLGGGDKDNFQNLERVTTSKPRSGMIRKSLKARDGELLVVADSAQIEARKVAWLAKAPLLLDAFAAGRDVYSEQASIYYGRPINRKLTLPDGSKPDEIPGFVSKVCTLGLGYGMSWWKLAFELLKGALGGPPVCFNMVDAEVMGVEVSDFFASAWSIAKVKDIPTRRSFAEMMVHCAVCERLVRTFRTTNREIPELWDYGTRIIEAMAAGDERWAFRDTCFVRKDSLELPSGLRLQYKNLRRFSYRNEDGRLESGWEYDSGEGWKKIYGGKFVENVDQGLCRVIVSDQLVDYARQGYHVGWMTHDEIGGAEKEERAARALNVLLCIMKTTPSWCPGLPLDAEGHTGTHYGSMK